MRMQMRRFTRLTNAFSQKIGEPESGNRVTLRSLQLLPCAWFFENHSRDGSGDFGKRVGSRATAAGVDILTMPRRLKLTPLQRDITWALEEAGAETIRALIATIKPSSEAEFEQDAEGLITLGLIRRENDRFILTERGRKALTE